MRISIGGISQARFATPWWSSPQELVGGVRLDDLPP